MYSVDIDIKCQVLHRRNRQHHRKLIKRHRLIRLRGLSRISVLGTILTKIVIVAWQGYPAVFAQPICQSHAAAPN